MQVGNESDVTNKIAKNAMTYIDELKAEITDLTKNNRDLHTATKKDKKDLDSAMKGQDSGKRENGQLQAERNQLKRERDELKKWKDDVKGGDEAVEKRRREVNDLMKD